MERPKTSIYPNFVVEMIDEWINKHPDNQEEWCHFNDLTTDEQSYMIGLWDTYETMISELAKRMPEEEYRDICVEIEQYIFTSYQLLESNTIRAL